MKHPFIRKKGNTGFLLIDLLITLTIVALLGHALLLLCHTLIPLQETHDRFIIQLEEFQNIIATGQPDPRYFIPYNRNWNQLTFKTHNHIIINALVPESNNTETKQ